MPIDQLADELKTAMLLPEDADSSTLVEMLKDKKRPSRRRGRGVRLNQAMAQSRVDSLEEFVEKARKGQIEFWKSDIVPSKLREVFNDRSLVINIPYDYIQHLDNSRPAEADELVANTEKIISEFDDLAEVISSSDYPNKRFIVAKYNGDIGTLVVFERVISKKRGHRLLPVTAYANRAQIIRGIIEKEKTLVLGPAISGQDTNIENDVIQGMSVLNENIPTLGSDGNILYQTAYHGSPHKFKKFSTKHIGTGEGGQAHGWGLYFAGDKEVSEDYRENLRRGRSRGQLFEVDIPENDVLLDEQKTFSEQPEKVQESLRSLYKSLSQEQLASVREEMKVRLVRRDKKLEEQRDAMRREMATPKTRKDALETVNAVKPTRAKSLFSPIRFERSEKYLHELYSESQIERLQKDADYLNAEKATVEKEIAALEQKIAEIEQRIEAKMAKERDAIDKARVDTLISRMEGKELYAGLEIALGSDRAASEALNAAGVKGITYEGRHDGRCFVVFDDKAIKVLKTYYQEQSSLYMSAADIARGFVTIANGQEYTIQLLKRANLSTILHETGHIALLEMNRLVTRAF